VKGITPVIATILILLMAVAAVGGAWVWYQRQSSVISGRTETKMGEQVEQQSSSSLSLAGIYTSGGKVGFIINNAGSSSVNLTGYKVIVGGNTVVNTSFSEVLGARSTATHLTTDVTCTSGSTLKVQLFSNGISTQQFTETCP